MKRLFLIVVLMMAVGCSGKGENPPPTQDTTEPDTTEPDTVEPDATEPDTTEPDTVLPPLPDVTLPPPDTATPDAGPNDAGPSGPAASCRVGLDCALECDNKECQDKCLEGMEMILWENAGAVLVCQEDECTDSTNIPCVLDKCYSDFAGCYFDGLTGDSDCKDTKICIEKEGCDDDCINSCLQTADGEAQQNYVKLAFCVKEQCGDDPDFDCQKQAELNICSTQWAHCYDF